MDNRVYFDQLPLTALLEIDETLQNNPLKLAMHINQPLNVLEMIFLSNNIRNPYEDLTIGKVIAIPDFSYMQSEVQQGSSYNANTQRPVLTLKQASISDNKITF
jgi:hypothetical protein